MPKYRLTESADKDLTDIYAYTYGEFGERQADTYFQSLEECFGRLAEAPQLGRDASHLRAGYRLFVHKRHSVYYQPSRTGILVVRVLGPGMMPERNLP